MSQRFIRPGFLFAIIGTTCGLPRINENGQTLDGLGAETVASAILKAKYNSQENLVFAPFGYASILTMLSEGARGDTQAEIRSFLKLPEDMTRVRKTYRSLVALYSGDEPATTPQFKTWFYVYENNSVNEEFVKTLRDDYLVEIKTIQRNFYDFDVPAAPTAEPEAAATAAFEVQVSDDVPETVRLADDEPSMGPAKQVAGNIDIDESSNLFDDVDLDGKNLAMPSDIDEIIKQKECSRFDEEVDDQQYVEVQALREGASEAAAEASSQPEDNETVHPIEKLEEQKKLVKIDDNAETLKQLDAEMGVLAVARKHPVTKKFQAAAARALEEINDVSSALSGNSLMGRKADGSQELESKMLLFNGLYFRGKWKTPFQVSLFLWHSSFLARRPAATASSAFGSQPVVLTAFCAPLYIYQLRFTL